MLFRSEIDGFTGNGGFQAGAVGYHTVNVLEDPEIRANLPRYSDWPTFPQLFVNGEFIGGCDITVELLESGELAKLVAEAQKNA